MYLAGPAVKKVSVRLEHTSSQRCRLHVEVASDNHHITCLTRHLDELTELVCLDDAVNFIVVFGEVILCMYLLSVGEGGGDKRENHT